MVGELDLNSLDSTLCCKILSSYKASLTSMGTGKLLWQPDKLLGRGVPVIDIASHPGESKNVPFGITIV